MRARPALAFPLLRYTALRVALFAVPFGVLMAVGMDLVWALLVAALSSSIASIFVLQRTRDSVATALKDRNERAQQRMLQRAESEDAWDDARRTDVTPEPGPDEPAG